MPVIEMKKVFLLAHRAERDKILDLLHRLGTVELVDAKSGSDWAEVQGLLEAEQPAEAAARYEARLNEARYCLDFLQRYFPVRKSFVQQFTGGKLAVTRKEFAAYIDRQDEISEIYNACREVEEKLTRLRNEETRERNLREELQPWAGFDLPLGQVKNSSRVHMQMAAVPVEASASLEKALLEEVEDVYWEVVSLDRETVNVFLIYPAAAAETVQGRLKEAAAASVSFPGLKDTAAGSIAALENRLAELAAEREAVLGEVAALLERRPLLMACFDYLHNEWEKQEATANLARTESSFLLEGWVPVPELPLLKKALGAKTETAVLLVRDPQQGEQVPVLLDNRSPAEAYEIVTRMYSMPARGELDPTPLMAPFFFLIFGICFSDVGYGLVLALAAFFIQRKLKLEGMGRQLMQLLVLGGISSAAFGVLFGSYFGDLINIKPLWFNPMDDPMFMLICCFALGLFQIYCGMAVQAYRSIKAGKVLDALFDQGLWFVFLNGLILLLLPGAREAGKWLAIGGAAGLILTQGRANKNLVKKFFSGLVSLYNVTGYLSDVLSYSRLLALGLATGVIASAINTMGGLLAGSIFGIVIMVGVLVGGHLFNLVISALGSYVHTSRLQYIEFFGKFFEGGGKAFRPFGAKSQYVKVEND